MLPVPPYYFYWSRIDNKHMTEPWLDQTLMDSAFRSGVIIPKVKAYKSCLLVTDFLTVKLASVYIYSKCFRTLIHSRTRLKYSGLDYSILNRQITLTVPLYDKSCLYFPTWILTLSLTWLNVCLTTRKLVSSFSGCIHSGPKVANSHTKILENFANHF